MLIIVVHSAYPSIEVPYSCAVSRLRQHHFARSPVFILFRLCTDTHPRFFSFSFFFYFFYFSAQTCEINQIKHYEGRIYSRFPSTSNEAEHCADGRPTAFCAESVIAKFTGISVEEAENHQMCQRAPEWKKCGGERESKRK